jgi:hypothetical protein
VICLTGWPCLTLCRTGAAPNDDFVKLPHFCFDDAAQDIFVEWCTELHTVHIAQ